MGYPQWRLGVLTVNMVAFIVTICSGQVTGWLPKQVFVEEDGFVIIEPEMMDYSETRWEKVTTPAGYLGEGFLRAKLDAIKGDIRDCSGEFQGPQEERLIFRIWVTNPGGYCINARVHHLKPDGDIDAFVHTLESPIANDYCVKRIAETKLVLDAYTQLTSGHRQYFFKKGWNHPYLAARSPGFGIDRVEFFMHNHPASTARAENWNSVPTKMVLESDFVESDYTFSKLGTIIMLPTDFSNLTEQGYAPWSTDPECYVKNGTTATLEGIYKGPAGRYFIQLTYLGGEGIDDLGTYDLSVAGNAIGQKLGKATGAGAEYGTVMWNPVPLKTNDKIVLKINRRGTPGVGIRALTFINQYMQQQAVIPRLNSADRSLMNLRFKAGTMSFSNIIGADRISLIGVDGKTLLDQAIGSMAKVEIPMKSLSGIGIMVFHKNGKVHSSTKIRMLNNVQ